MWRNDCRRPADTHSNLHCTHDHWEYLTSRGPHKITKLLLLLLGGVDHATCPLSRYSRWRCNWHWLSQLVASRKPIRLPQHENGSLDLLRLLSRKRWCRTIYCKAHAERANGRWKGGTTRLDKSPPPAPAKFYFRWKAVKTKKKRAGRKLLPRFLKNKNAGVGAVDAIFSFAQTLDIYTRKKSQRLEFTVECSLFPSRQLAVRSLSSDIISVAVPCRAWLANGPEALRDCPPHTHTCRSGTIPEDQDQSW